MEANFKGLDKGKIPRNLSYDFNTVTTIDVWWRKCLFFCNSTSADLTIDLRAIVCKFLLLSPPCELKLITRTFTILWYVLLFRALCQARHNSDCPAPSNNAGLSEGTLYLSNVFRSCTSTSTVSLLWVQYCNTTDSDTLNEHGKTIEKFGALRFITTENAGLPSR
jgi:hypothetical protein